MKDLIEDWKRNAARKDDENYYFLTRLKSDPDSDRIDRIAREAHREAFAKIDCTACGRCCRIMRPPVSRSDIARAAAFLEISEDEFVAGYLRPGDDAEYEMRALPCPFLKDDKCSIYEARPDVCREYPHTDKEDFTTRRLQNAANAQLCPAVYHLLETMKKRLGRFLKRR